MSSTPIKDLEDVQAQVALLSGAELVCATARDFAKQLDDLWERGLPAGSRPGWPSVDKLYTVAPGHITVLTGWPGSGKSEWLDAVCMNLARQGWRIAFYSAENKPSQIHVVKMAEKFLGLPFADGPSRRMTREEMHEAVGEISEYFGFMVGAADSKRDIFTLDHILQSAEAWFRLNGLWRSKDLKRGLVIDPWNELEHVRPQHWSETEYISASLSGVRAWARNNDVHVWIVAHPQKLKREDGKLPIPRPDSISGSQHWWNKADNAVTVWREFDNDLASVQIHVQKVRFKHIGKTGVAELRYDRVTGRYSEALATAPFRVVPE